MLNGRKFPEYFRFFMIFQISLTCSNPLTFMRLKYNLKFINVIKEFLEKSNHNLMIFQWTQVPLEKVN